MVTERKKYIERPSIRRIHELLSYDPITGVFTWRVSRKRNQVKKGSAAGYKTQLGYIEIGLDGHRIMAHVLAYFIMTGSWPEKTIDHKNRKPSDNRWENLRPANQSEQSCNTKLDKRNKSGFRGVYYNGKNKNWCAEVRHLKVRHRRSGFKSATEANDWVRELRLSLHGEFANKDL
jgi:hypothetical protein